jgi:hypothetical protein
MLFGVDLAVLKGQIASECKQTQLSRMVHGRKFPPQFDSMGIWSQLHRINNSVYSYLLVDG